VKSELVIGICNKLYEKGVMKEIKGSLNID